MVSGQMGNTKGRNMSVRFNNYECSRNKPTHPGQLFLTDLRELEINTELCLYNRVKDDTDFGAKHRYIQYIRLIMSTKFTTSARPSYRVMQLREESEEEYTYCIRALGASPYREDRRWCYVNWLTLKEKDNGGL